MQGALKLSGKVTLITGAGSGIGKTIALLFAKEGASIAASDINLESAGKTTEEIKQSGGRAIAIKADVSSSDDVDIMVDKTIRDLGGVHILVNNAGIPGENVPIIETSVDHWDKVVSVNLRSTYPCSLILLISSNMFGLSVSTLYYFCDKKLR